LYGPLKVFNGRAHPALSEEICARLGIEPGRVTLYSFSDGENYVQIDENVRGADVFIIQPTSPPVNDNLIELLIMLDAFKRSSARRITAVLPYYGYARQDRKDKPRVPITSKLVADLISAAGADRVLTLDLHASQIQGFFNIPVDHLFAAPVIVRYLRELELDDLIIVSPDAGGVERARAYAKRLGATLAIIDKRRIAANQTEVMHIIGDVEGRNVFVVDDIIDTAGTLIHSVEGGNETVLASGSTSENLLDPAWSPDGRTIICQMNDFGHGLARLVAIDTSNGQRQFVHSSNQRILSRVAWLPDGSGVVGLAREQSSNFTRSQIGLVSYPKGEYSPITRDTSSYFSVSVSAGGRLMATVQNEPRWNLQVMSSGSPDSQAHSVSTSDSNTNFYWTTDGKLVSDQANVLNVVDPANGNKTVIPGESVSGAPWVCAQTGVIVFVKFLQGIQNVWKTDALGTNLKQVTNGKLDSAPVCSPDGQSVFFVDQSSESKLAKAPIDGGERQVVSDLPMSVFLTYRPMGNLRHSPR